jgi:hypothetical protein
MDILQDPKTGRWRAKEPFKRYWQTGLWEDMFNAFLNIKDCQSIPLLRKYRENWEKYLESDVQKCKAIKVGLCRQDILIFEQNK